MPLNMKNLWPDDFGTIDVLTPVAILRQQGAALGERTKNIVRGYVATQTGQPGFRHVFYLRCDPLSYSIELLWVEHEMELYPAKLIIRDGPTVEAADADQFEEKLKEVFASPKTKKIIASLLAQSTQ